jgi:hypothetical protein
VVSGSRFAERMPVGSPVTVAGSAPRRVMAVAGLIGMSLTHLLDLGSKLEETPYLGAAFIGLIVASLVVAGALVRGNDRRAWLAAGLLAAMTVIGFVVSRTVGLPGAPKDDIGNWLEPLAVAALLAECLVIGLAAAHLARRPVPVL